MKADENAPHVDEIARALGENADRKKIGELLAEYLDTYKLPLPQAKRMVARELGGTLQFSSGEAVARKLGDLQPNEPNAAPILFWNRSPLMRISSSSTSNTQSCVHRHILLPTVVGWADWKWVKLKVGWSLQAIAWVESMFTAFTSFVNIMSMPSLI